MCCVGSCVAVLPGVVLVSPQPADMRGEGWALDGGGGRGRGGAREGGKGKEEEKASVQTASHATEFGWLFPPSEARRRSLVDTAWLRDFRRDIEALQTEIKRQTACVYNEVETICHEDAAAGKDSHSEVKGQGKCVHNENTRSHEDATRRESHSEIERLQSELRRHPAFVCRGERTRHNEGLLRTECHSLECCVAVNGDESECCSPVAVKCEERFVAPARVASCGELAVSSSVQTRVLDSSGVATSNEMASGGESNGGVSNRGLGLKEEGESSHCHNVGESSGSELSCDLDSGLSTFGDDAAKCDVYSKLHHKNTQRSVSDEDSCVGEESFLSDSGLSTYTSGSVKFDTYSSMHSDISRDSGIFTADDTSFISEAPGDVSLLQELGDVLSDEEVSLESCIPCGSLPLKEIGPGIKGDVGYNVWLKRFSSSNDLSESSWGSYEWEVKEDGEHGHKSCSFGSVSPVVVRRKKWDSEDDGGNVLFREEEEQTVKEKPCSGCEKTNEGVKVTQCRASQKLNEGVSVKECAVCKNLYEEPETKQRSANENRNKGNDVQADLCVTCAKLYQESPLNLLLQTQRISAMAKFSKSFQGLNKRVEDLRSGLDSLFGEVNESKHEFLSLERRTTQLLASTVSSRHRLARVRALTLLEDRLQEEWWEAYDPGSVPFHENYIV